MEQSFGCPSEEYEKEEGTLPHDFTTGKWRVHLIYPGERYGLDGCLTYELNAYFGVPAAAHRASYPLVEFCGSLPGDEKDEDGYSLSGEAKDATASRNGLSRNQMGIEEKAAECKEAATVLANGNAL